jgi:hypothetical protein
LIFEAFGKGESMPYSMVQRRLLGKGDEGCHMKWVKDPSKATPEAPGPTSPDATLDPAEPAKPPREIGGSKGPEPTRYGDWEVGGRCTDF